ncbi:hypothetical protein LJK88_49495 [Paenibacillus sp. P26]|nr:hypothetical protein LJK88_49495 [Paenibacillus sp. P26]UUZ91521.1 hypothetical protein LJK87_38860 [Paenibacillus sp. P25]
MYELQQYLLNEQSKVKSMPIHEAFNGKMANNEAEVKRLGRSMVGYPTNSQLMEKGLVPDPIQ